MFMQMHVTLTAVYLIKVLSILRTFNIVKNDFVSSEKTLLFAITRIMNSMLLRVLNSASS